MKPQQYLVCYKDKKNAKVHLYGPFVSETIAYNFCEELPDPVDGLKGVKPLSTYTHDETSLAAQEILTARLNH